MEPVQTELEPVAAAIEIGERARFMYQEQARYKVLYGWAWLAQELVGGSHAFAHGRRAPAPHPLRARVSELHR
jgi:hypothetical protein